MDQRERMRRLHAAATAKAYRPRLRVKMYGLACPYFELSKPRFSEELGEDIRVRFLPGSIVFNTGKPIRALVTHMDVCHIGDSADGTLQVSSDNSGLLAEVDLPANSAARYALSLLRSNILKGWSIYVEPEDFQVKREGKQLIVEQRRAVLQEVSVCPDPAFGGTTLHTNGVRLL